MGPGEHVGEAGRGFDETRFAYIDNCVKGFERLNVLSTMYLKFCMTRIKMSPVAISTLSTPILVCNVILNEAAQFPLEK